MRRAHVWRLAGASLVAGALVLWWALANLVDPEGNDGLGLLFPMYALVALAAFGLALLALSFRLREGADEPPAR